MKTRIISGIIGILTLIGILFLPKPYFFSAILILALIGLNEYFNVMKVSSISFKIIGFVISISFLFFYDFKDIFYYSLYLLILAAFMLVILDYQNKSVTDIFVTVLGTIFVSFLFSHILKVYNLENGNILIWLIFLSAWSTDTFAFFIGVNFGKHKFTPVSPKKSIEGSIGGLVGSVIVICAFGYYINTYLNIDFTVYNYIVIGVLGGIIGQIGDLAASLLKRFAEVKDFGKIMPGHGGVIDRFDSVLFSAPIIYYYLYFFMNIS